VLEHVDDPHKACNEIMRVSERGFIEWPSAFSEIGYGYPSDTRGWPYHKWFMWLDMDGTLVFRRKTKKNIHDFCSCHFGIFCHDIIKKYSLDLNVFLKKLPYRLRCPSFTWEGVFRYRVMEE
jgi:hypothetical protein